MSFEYALTENDLLFADQMLGFCRRLVARTQNPKVIYQVKSLVREQGVIGLVRFIVPGAPMERRGFVIELHRCPGGYRGSAINGRLATDLNGQVFSSLDWLFTKIDQEIDWLVSQVEVTA